MSDNKMGKYFKYAIGEIILVVIGILIALQVNNWNVDRKNDIQMQKVLLQLKEDYQDNLRQLEEKMQMRSTSIQAAMASLEIIDNKELINRDSLIVHLEKMIVDPTFDPIGNDLIATGNIRIIKSDTLKRLLSRWDSDVKQLQQVELEWRKMRTDIFIPFLIKTGLARDLHHESWKRSKQIIHMLDKDLNTKLVIGESKQQSQMDLREHVNEMEGVIANSISPNHVANLFSISLRKRIIKILELIDLELND